MTDTDKKVISPVDTQERKDLDIQTGDTVRVWQKIEESDGNIRLQPFEGVVLSQKHGSEPGATFTVRRSVEGVGVEKIFPLYSPKIDRIEITKRSKVRSSKLYHIRDKAARKIRRQMRRMRQVDISTGSDEERKKKEAEAEAEDEEVNEETESETDEKEAEPSEDGDVPTSNEAEQENDQEEESEEDENEEEKE